MEQVWSPGEPPIEYRQRGKYDWQELTRQMKERPGEWLLIDPDASLGLQAAIRAKKMVALRDPEWDFKVSTRKIDRENSRCEVWMTAERRRN